MIPILNVWKPRTKLRMAVHVVMLVFQRQKQDSWKFEFSVVLVFRPCFLGGSAESKVSVSNNNNQILINHLSPFKLHNAMIAYGWDKPYETLLWTCFPSYFQLQYSGLKPEPARQEIIKNPPEHSKNLMWNFIHKEITKDICDWV